LITADQTKGQLHFGIGLIDAVEVAAAQDFLSMPLMLMVNLIQTSP
jgi:hypothetical protein